MTAPIPEKVEILKVWYSVFCTLIDAHSAGEQTDAWLIEKLRKLRESLIREIPEVEREMQQYHQ